MSGPPAPIGIGENLVGLLAFLEGGLGSGITGIAVRMVLHRAATIGLLQFFIAGVAGDA
jgi:predicted transporter